MHSLLFGQKFRRNANTHTFIIRSDTLAGVNNAQRNAFGYDFLYGVCIITKEVVTINLETASSSSVSSAAATATAIAHIGYVFLSRFPFFSLHHDVLQSVLTLLYFKRLQQLSSVNFSLTSISKYAFIRLPSLLSVSFFGKSSPFLSLGKNVLFFSGWLHLDYLVLTR